MCIACIQPTHISQKDLLLGCCAGYANSAYNGNEKKSAIVEVQLETHCVPVLTLAAEIYVC